MSTSITWSGAQRLGEGGEAAQVAEQHRALAADAAQAQVARRSRSRTSSTTASGTKRAKVSRTRWRSKAVIRSCTASAPTAESDERGQRVDDGEDPARRRRRAGRATRKSAAERRPRRAKASSGRSRSCATGPSRPKRTIRRTLIQPGTDCSGKPCSTVQIAFAWTSAPGISCPPLVGGRVDVLKRGRGGADDDDLAAEGPGRHLAAQHVGERVRLRTSRAGRGSRSRGHGPPASPRSTGSPWPLRPRRRGSSSGRRFESEKRRRTAAGVAWIVRCCRRGRRSARTTPSPPKTLLSPRSLTSVVERTTPSARSTARISALSSRAVRRLGELDVVGDRLGAGFAQAVDQPRRGSGAGTATARCSSLKVLSSIPTTTMSSGRVLGAPDREARVDGREVERAQRVRSRSRGRRAPTATSATPSRPMQPRPPDLGERISRRAPGRSGPCGASASCGW